MQKRLHTQIMGSGPDLVLLHGWGLNSRVWHQQAKLLKHHFRIHLIDLPGYGLNHKILPETYEVAAVAKLVVESIPQGAALLGWSLGGLVAQQIALTQPNQISKLILVASSPCFVARPPNWPGIQASVLDSFTQQLTGDINKTLARFFAIQAMGSPSVRKDVKQLKDAVASAPKPAAQALIAGLNMLKNLDLREQISGLKTSTLLIYGDKDTLVPEASSKALGRDVKVKVFTSAAHAPFISHATDFCEYLIKNI